MAPNLIDCVIHWKKKLDKNSDEDVVLNVIRKLSKISITPEILEATHIGKTIRNLSKRNDVVGEKAKTVLNKWRNICVNLESVRNSKQKSIGNKDHAEKCSNGQNLMQEKNVSNERASSHEQKEKHKKNSLHHSSSKHSSEKSLKVNISSQSLGESEIKKTHLGNVNLHHNVEAKTTNKPHNSEASSIDYKNTKIEVPTSSDSLMLSSLKRKLTNDKHSDVTMNSLPKKIKSESHHGSNNEQKKRHSIHVNKDKLQSQSFKKEQCDFKSEGTSSVKQNSSSNAKKVKIQSSEEFTSSSASFETCLGFNDIVTVKKKKKSSKSKSSTKISSFDSVQFKKKSNDKKVAAELSPCDVNGSTKSSYLSKEKSSGSVPKKSTMFDAAKIDSSFLSAMQTTKKEKHTNEDVIKFTSSRKEKTAIYSGKKIFSKRVPTLAQCCYRVLIENIDILGTMSDTPYSLLKPVLEKCTPNQLFTIEKYNPHLLDDTNELWELHCKRDYKLLSPLEHETWRDVYLRGFDEREEKLKNITANISASMLKATPVRQVKLAFIDSYVKPPRDVLRRQAKSGLLESGNNASKPVLSPKVTAKKTATVSCSSMTNQSFEADKKDLVKANAESFQVKTNAENFQVKTNSESFQAESPSKKNTKPAAVVDPIVSSKDIANMSLVAKKPKVAPLMAKTLKAMKQCFRR